MWFEILIAVELVCMNKEAKHEVALDLTDRWLGEQGVVPATRSTRTLLAVAANLGAPNPENPRPLSDALAELRAAEDR